MIQEQDKTEQINLRIPKWINKKMKEARQMGGESYSRMVSAALVKVNKWKRPK